MICMLISASFSAHAVVVDATSTGNWLGYMNWFETDGSVKGAYADGTSWAAGDLFWGTLGLIASIRPLRMSVAALFIPELIACCAIPLSTLIAIYKYSCDYIYL